MVSVFELHLFNCEGSHWPFEPGIKSLELLVSVSKVMEDTETRARARGNKEIRCTNRLTRCAREVVGWLFPWIR